jgi:hypothetical protein
MKKLFLLVFIGCSALLVGCGSVPMTSDSLDSDAKKFQPEPGKASIYINRKKAFLGCAENAQSVMDGRVIGWLTPGTYQLISVAPGEHTITLSGQSYDDNLKKFKTEKGKNYFFDVSVNLGFSKAEFNLTEIDEEEGQKCVTASKRAETVTY